MNQILDERDVLCKNAEKECEKLFDVLRRAVVEGERMDQMERKLISILMLVGRACLKDVLEASGDGDVGETTCKDNMILKRSQEKHPRTYRSIFGVLEIERFVYAVREKQKIQAAPLDEQLGLPADDTSYVLEDWLAELSVGMPYESAAAWLEKTLEINASSTTAETRVRKLGGYVDSYRQQRDAPPSDEEGEVMVVLADGKGLPIRRSLEQRLEEELGKKPHLRRHKTDYEKSMRRRVRGDRKMRTQRATLGACYSIKRHPRDARDLLDRDVLRNETSATDVPRPQHKRLWAELTTLDDGKVSRGAERIFQHLAADVNARDPQSEKPLICIMDGDRSLWKLKNQYLPEAIGIVDLFHVMEKLWAAAHCFHPDGSVAAEEFVTRYLTMLLEGKVDHVRGVFQRFLNQQNLTKIKQAALSGVIHYFRTNREGMRYHEYLASGYPVGSGVIEGACKHVIGDRFCGAGMRWEIEGAQALMNLRVTHLGGEWPDLIENRIQTEQAALYNQAA